jgi:hypothetical protein
MPLEVEVPSYVSEAAQRGLDWHKEGKSGDGVTEQTLREARDMVAGRISKDKVRRMGPWFRRHEADMDAPKNKPDNEDFPGAGAVAWALWGGPTSGDIMRARDWAERKAEQLDQEEASAFDQSPKFKNTMSKLTPEAELADLRVAASALLTERDDLRATVEKLTIGAADELTAAKAELTAKDARIGELTAEVTALAEKVAALELTHVSAAKQAAEIVASTGTTPVAAEKQGEAPSLTVEQIKEQYAAMPAGAERVAFLQKHKAAILFGRLS